MLRVTQRTVYNLIYGGSLQAVRITGRITIIQKTDFMNMLHNLKVFTVPFLTDREHEKGSKELDRAVKNHPALTAELEHSQSRGFRR